MKFTVEQSALTDGVNWVSRSLSTRPIKTELLGIVIDATGNEVFLSASDLETASKAHFAAEVKEAGKVLVPGKLLAEISRSLPNKPITFALDGSRVLVTSGSAKFTLPTLSVDEYPNLPELPDSTGTVPSDTFATHMVPTTLNAATPHGDLAAIIESIPVPVHIEKAMFTVENHTTYHIGADLEHIQQ